MHRSLRIAAGLAALLALGSCSYSYLVRAVFIEGALAFVGGDPGRGAPCLSEFVLLDDRGRSVWHLAWPADRGADPCRDFPLVYGRTPAGARAAVAAKPIAQGRLYVVYSDDGLEGAFRHLVEGRTRRLVNSDPHEPEARWALDRHHALQQAADRAAFEQRARAGRDDDEPEMFHDTALPASR